MGVAGVKVWGFTQQAVAFVALVALSFLDGVMWPRGCVVASLTHCWLESRVIFLHKSVVESQDQWSRGWRKTNGNNAQAGVSTVRSMQRRVDLRQLWDAHVGTVPRTNDYSLVPSGNQEFQQKPVLIGRDRISGLAPQQHVSRRLGSARVFTGLHSPRTSSTRLLALTPCN